jgi:hypothetical protein
LKHRLVSPGCPETCAKERQREAVPLACGCRAVASARTAMQSAESGRARLPGTVLAFACVNSIALRLLRSAIAPAVGWALHASGLARQLLVVVT